MKRTLCILCALLAVLPPLSACQPTPEEDVVVNKGDGTMEAAVAAPAAAPYRYEAPERWVETFTARDQTVRIDAGVEVPDDEYHPVLLVERRSFDAQQAVDYYTALFGEGVELRENQYSYAEVLTDLQNTMKGMFVEIDPETGEQIWAPYEGQEEEIARLQQLLAETPAEDTFVPLTAETMPFPLTEGMLRLPDGSSRYVYCTGTLCRIRRFRSVVTHNENWVMQGEATPGEPAHALENIRITEEEAVAMGDEVVAALGVADELRLGSIIRARGVEDYTHQVLGEGYLLDYVLCPEGTIPYHYDRYVESNSLRLPEEEEYARPWPQEVLEMLVTEDGVLALAWTVPQRVAGVANENVQLLPFEEIQQHIRDLINFGAAERRYENDEGDLLISRVVLGAVVQRIPYETEAAYLAPVWIVQMTTEGEISRHNSPTILMVSAIDGSFVRSY